MASIKARMITLILLTIETERKKFRFKQELCYELKPSLPIIIIRQFQLALSDNLNYNRQSLMRNQDSSNESISQADTHIIRFNNSSKSSTPENEPDTRHRKFIEFEEFRNARAPLKIRIDDNDDSDRPHEQNWANMPRRQVQPEDNAESSSLSSPIERDYEDDRPIKLIIEYREKIDELSDKVRKLEQKLFYYEDYNRQLLTDYEQLKNNESEHFRVIREMDVIIQAKDQACLLHCELVQNLNKKIQYIEREQYYVQELEDSVLQKDLKIRELNKHIDKLYVINRDLETDLRDSSQKIVQLDKEIQKLSYSQLKQNIIKLKQNMPGNRNNEEGCKQRRSLKKSDKPITFKTEPNERVTEHIDRFHYSRNY